MHSCAMALDGIVPDLWHADTLTVIDTLCIDKWTTIMAGYGNDGNSASWDAAVGGTTLGAIGLLVIILVAMATLGHNPLQHVTRLGRRQGG